MKQNNCDYLRVDDYFHSFLINFSSEKHVFIIIRILFSFSCLVNIHVVYFLLENIMRFLMSSQG